MSQHLRLPFGLAADGTFATVQEDSDDEVVQNVGVILRTRLAERLATPDFGTPDPTFTGLDAADLGIVTAAIQGVRYVLTTGSAYGQGVYGGPAAVDAPYGAGAYGAGGYGDEADGEDRPVYGGPPSFGRLATESSRIDVRRQEG